MFEGGGYGVGLTVNPLEPMPWDDAPLPAGVSAHPARLGELMPVAARTPAELDAELGRVAAVEGALAAYKAELVARRARCSPDSTDRPAGTPGAAGPHWAPQPADDPLPGIGEFFPDELAMTLNCSRAAATTLAEHSLTLLERLPATWAALADGQLDWPRARAIAAELGRPARDQEPELVAAVEAAVLPAAAGLSIKRLRAAIHRELLARDAAAADRRRERATRNADVTVHGLPDGMAELRAPMPAPLAAANLQAVDAYARMAKADGDPRPLGQLRVAAMTDLLLRPGDTSRPPVTAHLTVLAPVDALHPQPGTDGPTASAARHDDHAATPAHPTPPPAGWPFHPAPVAEVDGHPITAAQLRGLLHDLDALCPGGLQAPLDGTLTLAVTDPDGTLRGALTRPELARLARRGCPSHPAGDCGCPVLHPPPAVDRYRPSPAHHRFMRTRDRGCRHPGCGNRAGWADLDHVIAHADGGPTDCDNLCCLCRRHHRLKTHAPGWRYVLRPDGTLAVTTPTGITRTTRPPGLDLLRHHLGQPPGPAPGTPPPDEDPPPFQRAARGNSPTPRSRVCPAPPPGR